MYYCNNSNDTTINQLDNNNYIALMYYWQNIDKLCVIQNKECIQTNIKIKVYILIIELIHAFNNILKINN